MRDKTEQITQAALKVFLKKGYKESTTHEIALEADVAEVTLFRKFQNKQKLFFSVLKPVIIHQFNSKIIKLAEKADTEEFIKQVIDDRLKKISRNSQVFRMLMAESIKGNLEEEVDLPQILFSELKKALKIHFDIKGKNINIDEFVRVLGGIFLSYLIWPQEKPYYKLSKEQQQKLINKYYLMLEAMLK